MNEKTFIAECKMNGNQNAFGGSNPGVSHVYIIQADSRELADEVLKEKLGLDKYESYVTINIVKALGQVVFVCRTSEVFNKQM